MPEDDYQEQLSSRVDDGGGCVEAWSELNDIRSEGETLSPDRRKAINLISAVLIGSGITSSEASAKSNQSTSKTVNITSVDKEREKNRIARRARSDRAFIKIRNELRKESRSRGERSVWKATDESGEVLRYTYSISFDSGDATAIWTDASEVDSFGLRGSGGAEQIDLKRYEYVDGEVVVTRSTVSPEEAGEAAGVSEDDITTAGTFPNCEWDTSCVGKYAATAGATFGCCGTCASVIGAAGSAATSCVCCVLSAIGFVSVDCDPCES